jgi:hypothetical protein
MPPQFEVRTEAEKWQGAFKAAQGAIREQGQVMSAALDNNKSLWETNKKLRAERVTLLDTCARLEKERNEYRAKLLAIPSDVQARAAVMAENENLRKAVASMRELLARSLQPELDTDQLRAELERVKKQDAELKATGLVPTQEEIADADARKSGWKEGLQRANESGADFERRIAAEKHQQLLADREQWRAKMRERAEESQAAGLMGEAYRRSFDDLGPIPGGDQKLLGETE